MKSVLIRSFPGPHFPAFGMNTKRYSVPLRIQSKCEKMRTRITPNTDTFYGVSKNIMPFKNFISTPRNRLSFFLKKGLEKYPFLQYTIKSFRNIVQPQWQTQSRLIFSS